MANLARDTAITSVDGFPGASRHGVFNYGLSDPDISDRYLHFKTNCPRATNNMCMIEAVGYSYATSQPIRCYWSWYSYSDGGIYGVGMQNLYSGMVPDRVYMSGDGYVCISTTLRNLYYLGVTFNCYNTAPNGAGFDLNIVQVGQLSTAGNFF